MARVLLMLEKLGFVKTSGTAAPRVQPDAPTTAPPVKASTEPEPPEIRHIPAAAFDKTVAENVGQAERPEDFPFSKIYASAGIEEPENGFTVYALIEMMEATEFAELDDQTRAKVIAGLLRRLPTGPVNTEDIVRDAALRDQALDAFERFLADRVSRAKAEFEEKNGELKLQIDEITIRNTELIEANKAKIEEERTRLKSWQQRKQAEENRLYEAVRPFAETNPVTLSDEDDGQTDD